MTDRGLSPTPSSRPTLEIKNHDGIKRKALSDAIAQFGDIKREVPEKEREKKRKIEEGKGNKRKKSKGKGKDFSGWQRNITDPSLNNSPSLA